MRCLLPWGGDEMNFVTPSLQASECNIPFLSDQGFKCPFQVVCPNSIGTPPKWIFVRKQETLLCLCGRCKETLEIYLKVRTLKLSGNVNSTGIPKYILLTDLVLDGGIRKYCCPLEECQHLYAYTSQEVYVNVNVRL